LSEIVPDFKEFRERVNDIQHRRDSTLIKTLYLLAARNCEILTKSTPRDKTTTNYGKFLKFELTENPEIENSKVLLVKCPIAKRKQENRDDIKAYYKYIALPIEPKFEPWTRSLIARITEEDRLSYDMTRFTVRRILKKRLGDMIPKRWKNPLRHFRITHLVTEYGFDPNDMTAYAGWTVKTGFGKVGFTLPSDQLQIYQHYRWRQYIKKLLKPKFKHLEVATT